MSIQHKESSRQDFVCPVRSRSKGQLVLIHLVRGIMQAGLCTSGTKLREWRACPVRPIRGIKKTGLRLSGMKSREWRACRCSSGTRKLAGATLSIRYEESSRRDCPCSSCTRSQVGRTSSVQYDVTQKECLSSSVWYRESSRWHFVHPV